MLPHSLTSLRSALKRTCLGGLLLLLALAVTIAASRAADDAAAERRRAEQAKQQEAKERRRNEQRMREEQARVRRVEQQMQLRMAAQAKFRRFGNFRTRVAKSNLLFGPIEPWDLKDPPRPFEEICFQNRSSLNGLSESEARRLLEPVGTDKLQIAAEGDTNLRIVRFNRMAKLTTWAPDAVLRCSFWEGNLKFHFCSGKEDMLLWHYPGRNWTAYRLTWQPGTPPPARPPKVAPAPMALVTTDDGRTCRLIDDTFEFRWQQGSIVLTKGDVRIMTVPMAEAPQAVYLEAVQDVRIRDLAVCRGGPAPEEPLPRHKTLLGDGPLQALSWQEKLTGGGRIQKLPDGGIELSADKNKEFVALTTPRPGDAPCEIICEIENPTLGTGFFVADDAGKPLAGMEFCYNHNSGYLGMDFCRPGNAVWGVNASPEWNVMPAVGTRQWLRIVIAAGRFRCWASGDGIHWGQFGEPRELPEVGRWQRLGIYIEPWQDNQQFYPNPPRSIRLKTLKVRRLDGLTDLLAAELHKQILESVNQIYSKPQRDDTGSWYRISHDGQPQGVDPVAWRYGCAVEVLERQLYFRHAPAVIDDMIRDGLRRATTREAKIHLLEDIAYFQDVQETQPLTTYSDHWQTLAREMLLDSTLADLDQLRQRAMMASPAHINNRPECRRMQPIDGRVAYDRLLILLGQQNWRELHAWCNRLAFWRQGMQGQQAWMDYPPLQRLVEWTASELGGVRAGADGHKTIAAEQGWNNAAAIPVSREAYNGTSDLSAAIEEQLFTDAARSLVAMPVFSPGALVPDGKDAQLFTSYSTAVKLLMARYPQLQKELLLQFKPADELRVREALAACDVPAIEAFTVQYYGTPAAAAAHGWLGDRLLSSGAFSRAAAHYRLALECAAEGQRQTRARLRLAAAMLGRAEGEPLRDTFVVGDTQIAAGQFEQIIQGLLDRNKLITATTAASAGPPPYAGPVNFQLKPLTRLTGNEGTEANAVPWQIKATDWPARQLAVVPVGATGVLISNRFQLTALDLHSGTVRWKFALPSGNQGPTHGWSLVPMRPTIRSKRVYARMLVKSGRPEIACVELASGKLLWECESTAEFVSDPLVIEGRLFVLAIDAQAGDLAAQLMWVELDRDKGEIISRRPLVELRSELYAQRTCQATVVGDRVIASMAGMTMLIDPDELLVWLRLSPSVPPTILLDGSTAATYPLGQYPQPPIVVGDRVYVTQVGMPAIECLDVTTGQVDWRRGIAGLRRILEPIGDSVLAETADGIFALRADNGETLWQREMHRLLDGFARPAYGLLAMVRRDWAMNDSLPTMVWLDTKTGEIKDQRPLTALNGKHQLVGPIIAASGALWCFSYASDNENAVLSNRDIAEMTPEK